MKLPVLLRSIQQPGHRTYRIARLFLLLLILIAALAPVLCNELPLFVKYKGTSLFPALSIKGYSDIPDRATGGKERLVYSLTDWKSMKKESVLWCPVPYSPGKSDWANMYARPPLKSPDANGSGSFTSRHWLGTTMTGADVLSGLVHGARISLLIGFFSMLIAGFTGIVIGLAAGFWGDNRIKVSRAGLLAAVIIGLPLSYFYGFYLNRSAFRDAVSMNSLTLIFPLLYALILSTALLFFFYKAGEFLGARTGMRKKVFLKVDHSLLRFMEIFSSIPKIILIISLSAIARPSILNLTLIIGFTYWVEIARLVRAEMLRIRDSEYIQAVVSLGLPGKRVVFRHALPNALTSAWVAVTFGLAAAILIESSLSFLGLGIPADVVTWGSLLNEGKKNFDAWWLVVFPGLALFATLTSIHVFGSYLSDYYRTGRNRPGL